MVTEAQKRATKKYEDKAYWKTLVRFPKKTEEEIRAYIGNGSLNNFIVEAVFEKMGKSIPAAGIEAEEPKTKKANKNPKNGLTPEDLQELINQKKDIIANIPDDEEIEKCHNASDEYAETKIEPEPIETDSIDSNMEIKNRIKTMYGSEENIRQIKESCDARRIKLEKNA